jgi:allophanate hydrolase subunit 2
VPPAAGVSAPMVCGAIQLPPSGEPIVLGPDHPTTGGYPVVATIVVADRGRFFALRPGEVVTFVPR